MRSVEVVVIGAGQAGLAMGYYLKQQGFSYLLLDKHARIGESWRERYDSLVLFTPRRLSSLPGLPFPGDPDGLPGKDDVADYLELYADTHGLSVQLDTQVLSLSPDSDGYLLLTSKGELRARQVVIATGPFQTPLIPAMSQHAGEDIYQIHTAAYQNERQLQEGPVLVVGSGNSGVQIAIELAASRPVYLSMGQRRTFLPLAFFGKPMFSYFHQLGLLSAPADTMRGKWLRSRPDPIFGYRTEMKNLQQTGKLQVKGRMIGLGGSSASFADGSHADIRNIIWATGFRMSYDWIQIPGAVDNQGNPLHERGVSPVPGLYFLGLPWQSRRSSALIGGVGEDASFLLAAIRNRVHSPQQKNS